MKFAQKIFTILKSVQFIKKLTKMGKFGEKKFEEI
jgi:hypothetical protein